MARSLSLRKVRDPSNQERLPLRAAENLLKPMAVCKTVSLFEREIKTRPSSAAMELLFTRVKPLSEGETHRHRFAGSTMLTMDLNDVAPLVRENCDAATCHRLAEALAGDARARGQAKSIGLAEAKQNLGAELVASQVDVAVRAHGSNLHIDVNIEGMVETA